MEQVIEYANNRVLNGPGTFIFEAPRDYGWARHVIVYLAVTVLGHDGSPPADGKIQAQVQETDDYESLWVDIPKAITDPVTVTTPLPTLRRISLGPEAFGTKLRIVVTSAFTGGRSPRWKINLTVVGKD